MPSIFNEDNIGIVWKWNANLKWKDWWNKGWFMWERVKVNSIGNKRLSALP